MNGDSTLYLYIFVHIVSVVAVFAAGAMADVLKDMEKSA